jgi:hypothetical protein
MSPNITAAKDPDIRGSAAALRRAARRALKVGLETGTPVWVLKKGRMVDLAREARRLGKAR